MKSVDTLIDNPWLSLKILKYPEKHINGYVFSHETRCDGKIVCILPYKKNKDGKYQYLIRREVVPCWDASNDALCSITGGVEKNDIIYTSKLELLEEAGYDVTKDQIVVLGKSNGSKSSDTIYHYITVDLTDMKRIVAKGDGSKLEELANCEWVSSINESNYPMLYTAYYMITRHLGI